MNMAMSTRKMKNRIFAVIAAATAIPLKPNTAATRVITKSVIAHHSIVFSSNFNVQETMCDFGDVEARVSYSKMSAPQWLFRRRQAYRKVAISSSGFLPIFGTRASSSG